MSKIKNNLSKIIFSYFLALTVALPVWAGGSKKKPLDDSNPIVLSHGILGIDDSQGSILGIIKYWGGMDDYLRSEGASVLTPGKTAIGGTIPRAVQEKEQILMWMAANDYNKINLLAHSQGAMESRYMVTNLGMADKVSVITSLNGVNGGAPLADVAGAFIPEWLEGFVDIIVDFLGDIMYGDNEQDVMLAIRDLSVNQADAFNALTPDVHGIQYYSYGSEMSFDIIQHPIMSITYPITLAGGLVYGKGAANDGVVPKSSMKWGEWKGGPDTNFFVTGVDHGQAINFLGLGDVWYDIDGYYLKMSKNAMKSQ